MLTPLVLAAALTAPAAPVPKDAVPAPTGPAPTVATFRADTAGELWVVATVHVKQKITRHVAVTENGKVTMKQVESEVVVPQLVRKSFGDWGAKFATSGGAEVTADEAVRRVKAGAVVLVSADGKPVGKGWLAVVAPDTLVMTAEGLANATFNPGTQAAKTAAPRLVLLAADPDGKVRVATAPNAAAGTGTLVIQGNVVVNGGNVIVNGPGAIQIDASGRPPAAATGKKPLDEVAFDAYTADGTAVAKAEALRRLKSGGLVLVAGGNALPDPVYLKAFKGDVLVLVSGELGVPSGRPVSAAQQGLVGAAPVAGAIQLRAAPVLRVAPVPAKPVAPMPREKKG